MKDLVTKLWQNQTRLHPDDLTKDIQFSSEAEFIEYVVKCVSKCNNIEWHFFKTVLGIR